MTNAAPTFVQHCGVFINCSIFMLAHLRPQCGGGGGDSSPFEIPDYLLKNEAEYCSYPLSMSLYHGLILYKLPLPPKPPPPPPSPC